MAVLWGLFIILLTLLPGKDIPRLPAFLDLFHPDKLVHLFIFGVYVFLQLRGFLRQDYSPFLRKNGVLITMLIALLLASGTELLQYYIPGRMGSIADFIANLAGCFIGWWASRNGKGKSYKINSGPV